MNTRRARRVKKERYSTKRGKTKLGMGTTRLCYYVSPSHFRGVKLLPSERTDETK